MIGSVLLYKVDNYFLICGTVAPQDNKEENGIFLYKYSVRQYSVHKKKGATI